MRLKLIALVAATLVILTTGTAYADYSKDDVNKSVKVWQKHAKRTAAYKLYKYVPKQGAPGRGRLVPNSGLTTADVTRAVQTEIDDEMCGYYNKRNFFCTYTLQDYPDPKAKKKKAGKKQPARYVVQISPEQAALAAVAQLKLPPVKPGVGPDPSINRWKMAAVGYPLWLWADGPTHVGPVSQSVANLRVSLDARLTSVTYQMGDGHVVTCNGPGIEWTRSVEAGAPSSCGYRYQKPSLPKRDYTVRATSHWDITWRVGGQTGVIPMDQEGTRQLPVGELQVLVR